MLLPEPSDNIQPIDGQTKFSLFFGDPDSITIVRKGIARRGISTEVESVYQKFSDYDLLEYLCIDTTGDVLVISPGHSGNHNFNGSAVS